jgi:hypothetical protein
VQTEQLNEQIKRRYRPKGTKNGENDPVRGSGQQILPAREIEPREGHLRDRRY